MRLALRSAMPAPEIPPVASYVQPTADSEESVAADSSARSLNGTDSESINVWPDETAEASFMAEARERGETLSPAPAARSPESDELAERDPKNLPGLDELVGRLSPELRETLDDLFRAKFTSVRRLPVKAFKS